jgi:hypothetical protein
MEAKCRFCGKQVAVYKTGERAQALLTWHLQDSRPCMGSQTPPLPEAA